jgi:hypothetical protein
MANIRCSCCCHLQPASRAFRQVCVEGKRPLSTTKTHTKGHAAGFTKQTLQENHAHDTRMTFILHSYDILL